MRATSHLAEFVTKSRWEDCPAEAVEAARRAILDCLGVMLAGSVEPAARLVTDVARAEGGSPLATVVGTPLRTGAVWAALANGTAAHALDFDDTNFAMMGHPSAPVLAAAMAAVMNPPHYEKGFHATGTLGTMGAAAAAGRLLGLDPGQTRAALALAASQASGLKENFGTMTKPFHAGHAARSGVLSALLAREGFTASEQAIEGPQGYFAVLGAGKREEQHLESLGAPWRILTSGVAVKPYPSCACTHSIIEGALELQRTHRITPEQIAEVTVGVHAAVPRILIHSRPRSGLEAKFSGEFSAAAALCEGRVGMATFRDDKTDDPAIAKRPVPGHPELPLSKDQLREKFMDCARLVLSEDRADTVRQMLEELDACPDLRSLTAILS